MGFPLWNKARPPYSLPPEQLPLVSSPNFHSYQWLCLSVDAESFQTVIYHVDEGFCVFFIS